MALEYQIGSGDDALAFNQIIQAFNDTFVTSGFDTTLIDDTTVEAAAGQAQVEGTSVSTSSSQQVTLPVRQANPRKAIIYVDDTGTLQAKGGNDASPQPSGANPFDTYNPAPPDGTGITGVVIDEVWLPADGSGNPTQLRGDRIVKRTSSSSLSPHVFGDGRDGSVTRSSNGTESQIVMATDYTVQSGVAMTAGAGVTLIYATQSITIDGTLNCNGKAGNGGSGGAGGYRSNGDPGQKGGSGILGMSGTGGAGSTDDGTDGGAGGVGAGGGGGCRLDADGGDGGDSGDNNGRNAKQLAILSSSVWGDITDDTATIGAGGGGGGGGGGRDDPDFPGDGGDGGNGGAGGGVVALLAPEVTVNGTVNVNGADGSNGQDAPDDQSGGGGGGGGGNGGLFFVAADSYTNTGTIDVSGGNGGAGGAGTDFSSGGGDGGNGTSGEIVNL